ncbi:CFI-box-CTERM domain-containing protein [Massilia sp. TS11]|uniref:CFI-box-CTERM domain-containing protein n=1 Tax=Massilia sp. TS11 TaxID=2908003 RepID=UPI0027D941E0|nr:CFI-box-CTERM domain-containing protein [Massilia sp. TS11]
MGYCERLVRFESLHGKRSTPEQDAARRRGLKEHERFYSEGVASDNTGRKPWCFVASAVFGGDAPETRLLREFRDRSLRRSRLGRAFIVWYYAHSPGVCLWLERFPTVLPLIRVALRGVVKLVRHLGSHGRIGGGES